MSFSPIPFSEINYESVKESMDLTPRRICFSSYHKDALRKSNNERFLGKFVLPFKESIKPIFEYETELTLFNKFGNYFYSIKIGEENVFDKIHTFINKYIDIVFLRDRLDLSISLSENLTDKNEYTRIGRLEDDAKYKSSEPATTELATIIQSFINTTPYYSSADFICAVPPSDPAQDNLPRKVVRLFTELSKEDISKFINWSKPKPALKDLELEKKWQTLSEVELLIETDIKNKTIILIDDLYQSGTTMQYIAMKLKNAGASRVFGLTFVKARNDKDYV